MARKNILTIAADLEDDPRDTEDSASAKPSISSPAFASLRDSVLDLENSSVKEIPVDHIVGEGPRDRLSAASEGIAELAESIRKHGQHVPIMVRPLEDRPGKFEIVYGRRRLAAIRLVGGDLRVKAIVRKLSDDTAVITQGQENNLRLDPTFIERALFARELREMGYDSQVIMDALNIEKTSLSKMESIASALPIELIILIGSAREIGRRQWRELADFGERGIDILHIGSQALSLSDDKPGSSERFDIVLQAVRSEAAAASAQAESSRGAASQHDNAASQRTPPAPQAVKLGRKGPVPQMALTTTKRTVSLTLQIRDNPNFSEWLVQNAENVVRHMQDKWIEDTRAQD